MRLSIRNSDEIIYPENIYCVGWNYHAHAEELNNLVPKEPIIFLKSNSCLAKDSKVLKLPIDSAVVHYEGELFVVIKYDCGRIDEITAEKLILGYGVGIDYTLREIQNEAKRKGEPW
ncbi:MAG: fumarylacetoacetate hydrolase family protein, partial [Spirochaetota bacterium]|nr:fumarylacetoacetate hydrolase family protein [Spirochaetota bacterium]